MKIAAGQFADAQFTGSTLDELRALVEATRDFPDDSTVSIVLTGIFAPVERLVDRLIVRPPLTEGSTTDAAQG